MGKTTVAQSDPSHEQWRRDCDAMTLEDVWQTFTRIYLQRRRQPEIWRAVAGMALLWRRSE